jgi:hypothetical protein
MGRARRTCGVWEKRNTYRVLMDIFKMDIREIGWDAMDWIDLSQDRHQ